MYKSLIHDSSTTNFIFCGEFKSTSRRLYPTFDERLSEGFLCASNHIMKKKCEDFTLNMVKMADLQYSTKHDNNQ